MFTPAYKARRRARECEAYRASVEWAAVQPEIAATLAAIARSQTPRTLADAQSSMVDSQFMNQESSKVPACEIPKARGVHPLDEARSATVTDWSAA